MATGKINRQFDSSCFIDENTITIDDLTVPAEDIVNIDTEYSPYTGYQATKTGYIPLAISGITVGAATNGSANASYVIPFTFRILTNGHMYIRLRNTYSSDAKIKLRVYILWVKE